MHQSLAPRHDLTRLHDALALLSCLPGNARRALVLRRIEGLAPEQIAAELGVSTRTARRHVAQAYMRFYDRTFTGRAT